VPGQTPLRGRHRRVLQGICCDCLSGEQPHARSRPRAGGLPVVWCMAPNGTTGWNPEMLANQKA
jgi:hypothetical protein